MFFYYFSILRGLYSKSWYETILDDYIPFTFGGWLVATCYSTIGAALLNTGMYLTTGSSLPNTVETVLAIGAVGAVTGLAADLFQQYPAIIEVEDDDLWVSENINGNSNIVSKESTTTAKENTDQSAATCN